MKLEYTRKGTVKKRSLLGELAHNRSLYLLSIPVVVYYLVFCYAPMFGLLMSFQDYNVANGIFGSRWVGLKNFQDFFQSAYFTRTLRNTLLISFYNLIFAFPMPIIFALLLNSVNKLRLKKLIQTVTYLPHFISMVVICGMIVNFFGTDGVITNLICAFGGENINYIGDSRFFRPIYVLSGIWQEIGWGSIIYLAALTGIDQELYEAAVIDGAGKWKQLWHVTIPGIMPTITLMLILQIGQLLSVGYEKIILLYTPTTYEVADVISSYVYRMGLNGGRYGFSTAVGMFQSIVNLIFLCSANFFARKFGNMSLF